MAIKPLPNEAVLLAKVAAGDERAFKVLFDGYYNVLGEYVFKLTNSLSGAQEIVQDTFIKIWLKRESLTEIKSFSNYIFILCRNQTYNELRKKASERNFLTQLDRHLNEENNALVLDDLTDNYRELIDAAVDKLPPQAQKVYLLSRDERMKYEEIAAALNISPETVKKHIQYAKRFITDEVKSKMHVAVIMVLLSPLLIP